jgi:uncharacterized membrane protein YqjE
MSTELLLIVAVVLLVVAAVAASKRRATLAAVTGVLGVLAAAVWLLETSGLANL